MSFSRQPKLRWFQYSLRSLLLLMLAAAIGMSWVAVRVKSAREQEAAAEAVKKLGGWSCCDSQPGPEWFSPLT